ncbi:MAG: hypothetical protein R2750_00335 [Bacteroidales bacterium]
METSQFLDAFGQSRFGFNVQGPLIKGKEESQTSLLGFFLSGDLKYLDDNNPTAKGVYVSQDDYLQYLQQTPLRPSGLAGGVHMPMVNLPSGKILKIKKQHRIPAGIP